MPGRFGCVVYSCVAVPIYEILKFDAFTISGCNAIDTESFRFISLLVSSRLYLLCVNNVIMFVDGLVWGVVIMTLRVFGY